MSVISAEIKNASKNSRTADILPRENQYHGVHLGNQKFTHPISGQEVVFDKNNNIVIDERYLGTYNIGPKTYSLEHWCNDVIPYWRWGNTPTYPTAF